MCLAWVGSGFLCDLEQVTTFLATTFFWVQVSCTCRQVSRPDRAGLELDLGKMLGRRNMTKFGEVCRGQRQKRREE